MHSINRRLAVFNHCYHLNYIRNHNFNIINIKIHGNNQNNSYRYVNKQLGSSLCNYNMNSIRLYNTNERKPIDDDDIFYTINKLYDKCQSKGDYIPIYQFIDEYLYTSKEINEKVISTFLIYLNKLNNFDGAIKVLLKLKSRNCYIDIKYFGSILSIAQSQRKWKEAYRLYQSIEKFGLKRDNLIYSYLLQILSRENEMKYLYSVIKDILTNEFVKDNQNQLNQLYLLQIMMALNHCHVSDCFKLFQYSINNSIYHNDLIEIALYICRDQSNWLLGLQIINEYYKKSSVSLSISCYHTIITLLNDCNRFDLAYQVYQSIISNDDKVISDIITDEMKSDDLSFNESIDRITIGHSIEIDEIIKQLDNHLVNVIVNDVTMNPNRSDIKNDIELHNLMIRLCNKKKQYSTSSDIINYISTNTNLKLNVNSIDVMITYYNDTKQYNEMFETFELINGMIIDISVYVKLLEIIYTNDMIDDQLINKFIDRLSRRYRFVDHTIYPTNYTVLQNRLTNRMSNRVVNYKLCLLLYHVAEKNKLVNPFSNINRKDNYININLIDCDIYLSIATIDFIFNYIYENLLTKGLRFYTNDKIREDTGLVREVLLNHITNHILPNNELIIDNDIQNGWIDIPSKSVTRWINKKETILN